MNPLEYIYLFGLTAKRYISIRNRKQLPFRTISIGNITTGGTGKTPAVIALAEEAKNRGFRPVILTRGYKGSKKGPCFVSKGSGPLISAAEAGDEPYLMASVLSGVHIVKSTDRYEGGMFAIRELGINQGTCNDKGHFFILDDGFQHWRLFRDKDIVLINTENPFGNGRLLPIGRLREPLTELRRADIIVLTKSRNEDISVVNEIRNYNIKSPIFFSSHRPVSIKTVSGRTEPLKFLEGKRLFGFCGLAAPDGFRHTITSLGSDLCGFKAFSDHHEFTNKDISEIIIESRKAGADAVITTAKDMARLHALDLPENFLIIEIKFAVNNSFYDCVFA